MMSAFEEEILRQYQDKQIWYYACYAYNGKKYGVNFNINNPNNGSICELGNKKLFATISDCKIFNCELRTQSQPISLNPLDYPLLPEIYMLVKNEFETKQRNNTLPPIQKAS